MDSRDKHYLRVLAEFDEDGTIRPLKLYWIDGVGYDIDRVLEVRPAASQKLGGHGDRYTVRIQGQTRYLFLERGLDSSANGRWFIEKP